MKPLALVPDLRDGDLIRMADDSPAREDARMPDRRHTDWRDPKFWLGLAAFAISIATIVWSASRSSTSNDLYIQELRRGNSDIVQELKAIRQQQVEMGTQLNALAITGKGQEKEMDFLQQQLSEFKEETREKLNMQEARIIALERKK